MISSPHFKSLKTLYNELEVSTKGLSKKQIIKKRKLYGANKLPEAKAPGFFLVFIHQFRNAFIYILLIATIISLSLDQFANALFIFIVLMINAGLGTYQELTAQKRVKALRQMVPRKAMVIRGGRKQEIKAHNIVPGDILLLASGDKVSADLRLIQSKNL